MLLILLNFYHLFHTSGVTSAFPGDLLPPAPPFLTSYWNQVTKFTRTRSSRPLQFPLPPPPPFLRSALDLGILGVSVVVANLWSPYSMPSHILSILLHTYCRIWPTFLYRPKSWVLWLSVHKRLSVRSLSQAHGFNPRGQHSIPGRLAPRPLLHVESKLESPESWATLF